MSLKKWNVERHVKNIHWVKPNIDQQKIRSSEFHTESDCPNHKSREILQKIGAEIVYLIHSSVLPLLKEYTKTE